MLTMIANVYCVVGFYGGKVFARIFYRVKCLGAVNVLCWICLAIFPVVYSCFHSLRTLLSILVVRGCK